jgi:hypothetical protein
MSLIDAQNVFSGSYAGSTGTWTGQSYSTFATAGSDFASTNVIDLTSTNTLKDMGAGQDVYLVLLVTTAIAASGGAANVTFKLASDSTTNLATSPTTHWTSGAIAKGTLVAGYQKVVCLPREKTYERYLGLLITPDTNNLTGGAIVAFLTTTPDVPAYYAKNYTIS